MHKTTKQLIKETQEEIKRFEESKYDYSYELKEKKDRVKDLRRLSRKFASNPLVEKMEKIVDKEVEHYHADFFLHDLNTLESYEGRFAWYVGEYGTHFIKLDCESEEFKEGRTEWIEAVNDQYGKRYKLYECNTITHTIKRTKYEKIAFSLNEKVAI